jgi:hypothetical protein
VVTFDETEVRKSMAEWLRWRAVSQREIELAPERCRLFLRAMHDVSGGQVICAIAKEIVGKGW